MNHDICVKDLIWSSKVPPFTCYQVCYNSATFGSCPAEFTPLLHENEFPDMYEVMPLMSAIAAHQWEDEEMVGFFSPKFRQKTQIKPSDVIDTINILGKENDALLFTSFPLNTVYFLNPWEQGEASHPGILELLKILAEYAAPDLDLMRATAPVSKSVYSNYFVAKKSFWDEWLRIVLFYMKTITADEKLFNLKTVYGDTEKSVHPFVIERIPTLILLNKKLKSEQYFWTEGEFPLDRLEGYDEVLKRGVAQLAELKKLHYETKNDHFFREYWSLRQELDTYVRQNFKVKSGTLSEFELLHFNGD